MLIVFFSPDYHVQQCFHAMLTPLLTKDLRRDLSPFRHVSTFQRETHRSIKTYIYVYIHIYMNTHIHTHTHTRTDTGVGERKEAGVGAAGIGVPCAVHSKSAQHGHWERWPKYGRWHQEGIARGR